VQRGLPPLESRTWIGGNYLVTSYHSDGIAEWIAIIIAVVEKTILFANLYVNLVEEKRKWSNYCFLSMVRAHRIRGTLGLP